MSRIEHIGDATLYLGDCREILPTLERVDAVVTDPPYGIEGGVGRLSKERGKGDYTDAFQDTPEWIAVLVKEAVVPALGMARRAALTPGNRCFSLYPQPDSFGAFYQPAAVGLQRFGAADAQPIFYYGEPIRSPMGATCSYRLTEPPAPNGHPCTKPERAWTWLVAQVSREDENILDPFMGSGTTGVACMKLGRRFIGIEIELKYFDIACRRIEEAWKQPRLFEEPKAKPQQVVMELEP